MDPTSDFIGQLIQQGVLGLVIVGMLTGWLVPKWVLDEYRVKLKTKDQIIERQSSVIERLALKAAGMTPARRKADTDEPE